MSAKTSAEVLIGGKIYTLSGYESEDYLQRVANYINGKINEFDEMDQFRRFPGEMKATLVQLNIADDYFKAREQAEKLDWDVKEKEKEIYELKHELISLRIKAESSEKAATELERENRKLLLHKSKLENALEDALLGKVKGQVLPDGQGPEEGGSPKKAAIHPQPEEGAAHSQPGKAPAAEVSGQGVPNERNGQDKPENRQGQPAREEAKAQPAQQPKEGSQQRKAEGTQPAGSQKTHEEGQNRDRKKYQGKNENQPV